MSTLQPGEAQILQNEVCSLRVNSLKVLARSLNLAQSGRKADLQERIIKYIRIGVEHNDIARVRAIKDLVEDLIMGRMPQNYESLLRKHSPNSYGTSTTTGTSQQQSLAPKKPWLFFRENPFFVLKKLVTPNAGSCPRSEGRGTGTLRFTLTDQELETLRTNKRMKLLLLCGVYDRSKPATDAYIEFPSPIEIHFNKVHVKDNVKGIKNKPGTAKPANLTPYVKTSNELQIVYAFTKVDYLIFCYIVEEVPPERILAKVLANPRTLKQTTLDQFNKPSDEDDDDEIQEMSTRLSLKCPLSFQRMKYPVKSVNCDHLPCFDALSFIYLQEQVSTWCCPICNSPVRVKDLSLNEYVLDILKRTPPECDTVEIELDGRWTPLFEDEDGQYHKRDGAVPENPAASTETLDLSLPDMTPETSPEKPRTQQQPAAAVPTPAPAPVKKASEPVVISLDSDDEDFDLDPGPVASTSAQSTNQRKDSTSTIAQSPRLIEDPQPQQQPQTMQLPSIQHLTQQQPPQVRLQPQAQVQPQPQQQHYQQPPPPPPQQQMYVHPGYQGQYVGPHLHQFQGYAPHLYGQPSAWAPGPISGPTHFYHMSPNGYPQVQHSVGNSSSATPHVELPRMSPVSNGSAAQSAVMNQSRPAAVQASAPTTTTTQNLTEASKTTAEPTIAPKPTHTVSAPQVPQTQTSTSTDATQKENAPTTSTAQPAPQRTVSTPAITSSSTVPLTTTTITAAAVPVAAPAPTAAPVPVRAAVQRVTSAPVASSAVPRAAPSTTVATTQAPAPSTLPEKPVQRVGNVQRIVSDINGNNKSKSASVQPSPVVQPAQLPVRRASDTAPPVPTAYSNYDKEKNELGSLRKKLQQFEKKRTPTSASPPLPPPHTVTHPAPSSFIPNASQSNLLSRRPLLPSPSASSSTSTAPQVRSPVVANTTPQAAPAPSTTAATTTTASTAPPPPPTVPAPAKSTLLGKPFTAPPVNALKPPPPVIPTKRSMSGPTAAQNQLKSNLDAHNEKNGLARSNTTGAVQPPRPVGSTQALNHIQSLNQNLQKKAAVTTNPTLQKVQGSESTPTYSPSRFSGPPPVVGTGKNLLGIQVPTTGSRATTSPVSPPIVRKVTREPSIFLPSKRPLQKKRMASDGHQSQQSKKANTESGAGDKQDDVPLSFRT